MTPPRTALDNLTDAMVEDILSMSDEEILQEMIEDGVDPDDVAAQGRRIFERACEEVRMTTAKDTSREQLKQEVAAAISPAMTWNACDNPTRMAEVILAALDVYFSRMCFDMPDLDHDQRTQVLEPKPRWPVEEIGA